MNNARNILLKLFLIVLCCSIGIFVLFAQTKHSNTASKYASNTIFNYLKRIATNVTHQSLAEINTLNDWQQGRQQRYQEFLEMMSLTDVPLTTERPPLNVVIVDTLQRQGYRIEKLYYESLPDLYVVANLYVPDSITAPVPAILYTCGHAKTQKVHYQAHPRKFAQLGFVCLIIETIQWGEVCGEHYGPYNNGFFHWYSRGYTPGGVEVWNGIRGLDLLCQRTEVDTSRLGVTGNSGGGAQSWYIPAIDSRVKASASSCATGTIESHLHTYTINMACDCMMPINTYARDYHDIGALIAPRPFLIASTTNDPLYKIDAPRQAYTYTKRIYDFYGATDNLVFLETEGGHGYNEVSRPEIFSFFMKHLMGQDIPPSEVGDVDESEEIQLSEEDLRVYVDGAPIDDRTTTIQETFVKLADIPRISNITELSSHRDSVIDLLASRTFNNFPEEALQLNISIEFSAEDGVSPDTVVYRYDSEQDWRLKVDFYKKKPQQTSLPTMLVLRNLNEADQESENFVAALGDDWHVACLGTRGIGEHEWVSVLQKTIRRMSAWTGRTIASMRVYDVLRCLEMLRTLEHVDTDSIGIAARGEMCAVALYAALLDENVKVVILKDPPATQNAASSPDGRGDTIEMLNCLRITDLPQVAGLLYPTTLVMVDTMPDSYQWAETLYQDLGEGASFIGVNDVSEWILNSDVKSNEFAARRKFELYPNYPNPFNATTRIEYFLMKNTHVNLTVYNLLGEEIRLLINEKQTIGKKSILWDGRNNDGEAVATGIYVYRLMTGNEIRNRKMIYIK